jgi:hypothetical protein
MSSEDMFKTPPAKSEYVTRKAIVDRRLRDAGWKIVRFDEAKALAAYERCAIEEYPTENGPADYALCVGGKILGIVEAKKLTLGPQNVLMQAERDLPVDLKRDFTGTMKLLRNPYRNVGIETSAKSLILRVYDVLAKHSPINDVLDFSGHFLSLDRTVFSIFNSHAC